jgi:hypothetical protein
LKIYQVIIDELNAGSTRRIAAVTSTCWRTALDLVEEAMEEAENPWTDPEPAEEPRRNNELLP